MYQPFGRWYKGKVQWFFNDSKWETRGPYPTYNDAYVAAMMAASFGT